MRQRLLVSALAAGCILTGAAAFLVWMGQDRTPPEITLEKEQITYTEGENYEILMKGISAKDNLDGDLSDQVFVDRIVPSGENSAVVYYGVMDQHNNVGTAKRKITYHTAEKEEGDMLPEDGAEGDMTAEEMNQEPAAETEELQPNGIIPAIALTTDQAVVPAGSEFDLLSVVQDVADDMDDRDSLFQRISVDGWYDLNTPGSYELKYYVTDSNGNVSEPCILILTVQ